MRIVCVGGGPGGLYTSLLVKRAHPSWDVRVLEANHPGETFGFGVVFSEPTLSVFAEADPAIHAELLRRSVRWDPIEVRRRDGAIRCYGQGFAAIGRHALLAMLREEAERVGVRIEFDTRVDPSALPEADVVVAADGARSEIRKALAETIEPSVEIGTTKYIWFGTSHRFECLTFLFEENDAGAFAVHGYPYAENASTFLVETDEATWKKSGLAGVPRGSEEEAASLAYCEHLFAAHLGGHRLVANRSFWTNFRTLRTQAWHSGNVVLVGDSAHTTHFSLGSGTKLAMEDALSLARALTSEGDPKVAFAKYEEDRRPRVRKLQQSAGPSMFWWEHFGEAMGQSLEAFAFRFLTRNYKVTRASLLKRDAAFVERVDKAFGPSLASASPFDVRGTTLANRIVSEGGAHEDAGLVLHDASSFARSGSARHGVLLRGGGEPPAGVDWIELELDLAAAETVREMRAKYTCPISVRFAIAKQAATEIADAARAAIAAGADLVTLAPEEGRETRALLAAEALRFPTRTPLAIVSPIELADTLILSERTDLVVVRRQA